MPIRNNLRVIMAKQGFRSVNELCRQRNLKRFKYARINRFANQKNHKLDGELIEALCKELDCDLRDMLYIEDKAE